MQQLQFTIADRTLFQRKCLEHFKDALNIVFINRNDGKENLLAISDSNRCNDNEWKFGFVGYDYKNKIEKLTSENYDGIDFPELHFFTPELLFQIKENAVTLKYQTDTYNMNKIEELLKQIKSCEILCQDNQRIELKARLTKDAYLEKINQLKHHIRIGDIYEVNFCHEYYADNTSVNPTDLYFRLNKKSPTPFSGFVKHEEKYLLCASPERFIKKQGSELISQPIKGTIRRGKTAKEDQELKQILREDEKERSENIMIVDLVRNDLAKVADRDSVSVEELCGIYSFAQVHQMISTIKAKVNKDISFESILKAAFPMGSMTGAPKVKAMELIEKYEVAKRGIYSGTFGFITPENDFDFNVVIRSITYNRKNRYLSYLVGGAITDKSIPEKEYEESLLKAKAMKEVLTKG